MNSQQQPNRLGAKCSAISAPASTASTVPSDTNFHAK
jgi:hypothetical protein